MLLGGLLFLLDAEEAVVMVLILQLDILSANKAMLHKPLLVRGDEGKTILKGPRFPEKQGPLNYVFLKAHFS